MQSIRQFVPVEKMSKRMRKAYYAEKRGDWNGVNPVTKVIPDKRRRNEKNKQALRELYS